MRWQDLSGGEKKSVSTGFAVSVVLVVNNKSFTDSVPVLLHTGTLERVGKSGAHLPLFSLLCKLCKDMLTEDVFCFVSP